MFILIVIFLQTPPSHFFFSQVFYLLTVLDSLKVHTILFMILTYTYPSLESFLVYIFKSGCCLFKAEEKNTLLLESWQHIFREWYGSARIELPCHK